MNRNIKILIMLSLFITILSSQTFQGVSNSIYSDLKAHTVGDVITVLVVEQTKASQDSKVNHSSQSTMGAESSSSGNILPFFPLLGTKTNITTGHDGKEGTDLQEKLTGKLTAIITERTETGMLKIEGERILNVNGEKNLMKVTGLIRTKDIQTNNTIYSYNIANAEIIYKKNNITKKFLKPGSIQRLVTTGLGLALVGLAYIGFFVGL